jgi:hypothetical protein
MTTTTIGRYNKLTSVNYYPAYTENQNAEMFTIPDDGHLTVVGAWLGPMTDGSWDGTHGPTTRLCVWDSAGNLLGYTAEFTAWGDADGNPTRYERTLSAPIAVRAGQQVKLGLWCYHAYHIWAFWPSVHTSTHYWKGNGTATGPSSIAGASSDAYEVNVYALLEVNSIGTLGTLVVDTAAAPTLTFSWDSEAVGASQVLIGLCKTAAPYGCDDPHTEPTWPKDLSVSAPADATSVTVNLSGAGLSPGTWKAQAYAVGSVGSPPTVDPRPPHPPGAPPWPPLGPPIELLSSSTVVSFTVACPTPWPWPQVRVDEATGTRHFTAAWKAWALACGYQVSGTQDD